MATHFNPRRVLRQVSNQLLREFFTRRDQLDHIPWPYLPETYIRPIFAAWQRMPEAQRKEIQVVLQNIHALADQRGVRVLAEEIQQRCPEQADEFTTCRGRYDKAMWAYLTVPEVFAEAALFARADALSTGRYWVTHNSLPREPLAVSGEAQEAFRQALSDFYWRRQLRGSCVVVEHYRRCDGDDYFFVYLDDYPDSRLVFNDAGQMEKRTDRCAFDNVFVFSPEEGALSLYAKGGKQVHIPLHQAFCETLLGMAVEPCELLKPAFQLDHLIDPSFPLTTDPADQVAEARILALGLEVRDRPRRRITLEADPGGPSDDIHQMLDRYLSLSPARLRVKSARFRLMFLNGGKDGPRTLTFRVSCPRYCNLKSKPDEMQSIGQRCLKLWGIVVDE